MVYLFITMYPIASMPMKSQLLILILLSYVGLSNDELTFKQEIDMTYNFHPHKMSRNEQQSKRASLDSFFNRVKSDTTKYLPLLRKELLTGDHLPYFFYDGSCLLLDQSKSHNDTSIVVEGLSRCYVDDPGTRNYVSLLMMLAEKGVNVTKAAVNILHDSIKGFYLPNHAFDFHQGYCITYTLLYVDPALYVDTLISIFNKTKNTNTQRSIVTTLWFTYSCKGDDFLRSLKDNKNIDHEIVSYAQRMINGYRLSDSNRKIFEKMGIDSVSIEKMRRDAISRFSDEAIWDLDLGTRVMREKFKCR